MVGVDLKELEAYPNVRISVSNATLTKKKVAKISLHSRIELQEKKKVVPIKDVLIFEDADKARAFISKVYRLMRDGTDGIHWRFDYSKKATAIKKAMNLY